MARVLHKRYTLPPGVSREDVEQEMLLAAWRAVESWEEGRASLVGYVVWSAHSCASKYLHKQRGADQHTRKGPGRYALNASLIQREDGTSVLDEATRGAPDSERQLDVESALEKVARFSEDQSEAQRKALIYYVEEQADEERAARRLLQHGELFRVRSPEHARRIVKGEVRRLRHAVLS